MNTIKREVVRGQDIACGCGGNTDSCHPYPYPPYPPYPDPDCPCPPPANSIEAQIAKLSKKSATIRKMIENLVTKNKPIMISIGCSQYNFGGYLNKEGEVTAYGQAVLTMLETELEAIKTKMLELVNELEATDTSISDDDGPVII